MDNENKKLQKIYAKWRVSRRRRALKEQGVEYKGGKCQRCGYDKCVNALQFHHLDPNEKEYSLSSTTRNWEKTKKELDKCILLCANCHAEDHYKEYQEEALRQEQILNTISIEKLKKDTNKKFLNKKYNIYNKCKNCSKLTNNDQFCSVSCFTTHKKNNCKKTECKGCGKLFGLSNNKFFCSKECSIKNKSKIDWPNKENLQKMFNTMPIVKIAKLLKVSDQAVHKKLKKLNIK